MHKDESDNHYYEKFEDGTVNDITEEIPFEIPYNWSWTRIKNLSSIVSKGTTPKGGKNAYLSRGINFLRAENVKASGKVSLENVMYIDENTHKNFLKRSILEDKDILICIAGTLGRCAVITKAELPANTNQAVCFIRLINKNDILINFILNALSSFEIQKSLLNQTKVTAIPNLTLEIINNCLIPIPPINKQKEINNKIKKLLPYIEKYETIYKKIESLNNTYKEKLKKSILQYGIQGKLVSQNPDDGSADVLINKILEEKRELIKTKQIKKENLSVIYKDDTDNQFYEKFDDGTIINITDEIPFEIPENWCWSRFGNILTKLTDGSHKTPKYVEKGIPFVSVKDMSSGLLKFDNTKYITIEEHKILFERCNPQKGDIILSKVGTTGIPVIVETDIEFSLFVSLALLKFNNKYINKQYLKNMILSPLVQNQCRENTKGVGNKNWVMKDIAKTLIVIPPYNEQVKIIKKLEIMFKKL